jgi:hypothetical protein
MGAPSLKYSAVSLVVVEMVRTLIDRDGNIAEGRADLEVVVPREGRVLLRIFRCPECRELIDAFPNRATTHECDTRRLR